MKVEDTGASTGTGDFKNGFSGIDEYGYYPDGSLKFDKNKGITNIIYNYLSLPERIEFGANQRIENVYTADGIKLFQNIVNGSVVIKTDYIGDLIYRNDTLQTISHDEGIIKRKPDGNYKYQYSITDHLGNTRVIFEKLNDTTYTAQENHYGAWGEVLHGLGTNGDWNFLFQGKEFVDAFGYNSYDFHARGFDSNLGRFDGTDPVDNYGISNYAGMMNNPQSYIDPDGRNPLLIAMAIGAGISALSNTISQVSQNKGFNNWNWGSFGKSVAIGAVSGAVSFGIGSAFGPVSSATQSFSFGKELARASIHGFTNGVISEVTGGNFGQGFVSGAFGSFTGSLTDMIGNPALQIGASSIAGGVGSKISGGDFWSGFAIGGVVAGANHFMHPPEYEYNGKVYTSKADLYAAILADQSMEQFGISDVIALGLVASGQPLIGTRGKFAGATEGTSLASKYLSKIPGKSPVGLPMATGVPKLLGGNGVRVASTKLIGRFAGRAVPFVGWGMLAWDAGKIIYNTQSTYNLIIHKK